LIPDIEKFYRSPFSNWPPQYRTNSTLFDFNVLNWFLTSKNFYRSPLLSTHMSNLVIWWYRTMLNFCGIVVAILKMATGRNFSMLGINSGHHYLPTYQIFMNSGVQRGWGLL
jgi:hypothetical protein